MTDKNKWTNCDFIDYGDYRNNEAEREKWLEIRRRFIGGSDAGAFNPDSKYKSPYLLYADKKGNAKPFTGNEATRRGNLLEPVIRAETGRIIGAEIVECNYALINKDHPYMGCNLDGVIINDFEFEGKTFTAPVGFEAKTSMRGDGFDKAKGEIPGDYYYQVQHCMAVTGIEAFILSVYVTSRDELQVYSIPRNDDFIKSLVEVEGDFWTHNIEAGVSPAPRGLAEENEILDGLVSGGEVEVTAELEALSAEYEEARKAESAAKAKKDEAAAKIKAALIAAQTGEGGKITAKNERTSLSYSIVKSTRVDTDKLKNNFPPVYEEVLKESESGRLSVRVKEAKK